MITFRARSFSTILGMCTYMYIYIYIYIYMFRNIIIPAYQYFSGFTKNEVGRGSSHLRILRVIVLFVSCQHWKLVVAAGRSELCDRSVFRMYQNSNLATVAANFEFLSDQCVSGFCDRSICLNTNIYIYIKKTRLAPTAGTS